jgi:dienelactone hydrolase
LAANAPAVLVVQEWWGVNNEIKAIAQKVSDLTGAEVFVPDLYKVRELQINSGLGLDASIFVA